MYKYRAWNYESNTMLEWDEIREPIIHHGELVRCLGDILIEEYPFTPLMYTGMNFSKGNREACQGDILGKHGYWSVYIDFHEGSFVKVPCSKIQKLNWEWDVLTPHDLEFYEYGGNIYENPEIIED